MPNMEFLAIFAALVSSLCLGVLLSVYWVWGELKRQAAVKQAELAKLTADFADTVSKAAAANNTWAAQITALEDKVLAHEMSLKGMKR